MEIYQLITFLVDKAFGNDKFQKMLSIFREEINISLNENKITEFLVMSFDSSVNIEKDFCLSDIFEPPVLTQANGSYVAMNQGILLTLDRMEGRKALYRSEDITARRSMLILVASRIPTDSEYESQALSALKDAVDNKRISYVPFLDEDITPEQLEKHCYPRYPNVPKATERNIRELFRWHGNQFLKYIFGD